MLKETCLECRNYFYIHDSQGRVIADRGNFSISDGVISKISEKYMVGQYIRIIGSVFNDGLYQIDGVNAESIDVAIRSENYPQWVQPTGAIDAYSNGDRVTHQGIHYVSLIDANVTVPGVDIRYWHPIDREEHSVTDEEFEGVVIPLAIPSQFLELAKQIELFNEATIKNPTFGQVTHESFGGYSYTIASGKNGIPVTWKETFESRLNNYRKMIEEKV